jgi:hypothetical protein
METLQEQKRKVALGFLYFFAVVLGTNYTLQYNQIKKEKMNEKRR